MSKDHNETENELIDLLLKNLPQELSDLRNAKNENNHTALLKLVHRLHGAVCYCGVPELQLALNKLETGLRNDKNLAGSNNTLFNSVEKEILNLLGPVR